MNNIFLRIKINELKDEGYLSFLLAIISLIVLAIQVNWFPPLMALWTVCWIIENISRMKEIYNIRKEYKLLLLLFIIYYLWQVAGIFYSENVKLGLLNIFSRISLILFPLILINPGERIKQNINLLLRIFAISSCIYIVYCFGNAFFRSISIVDGHLNFCPHPAEPWLNYFYAAELTISKHPSYVAMYMMLATIICFESWLTSSKGNNKRLIWLILSIFLFASQYFISSRAGILISLILVPFYFFRKLRHTLKIRYLAIIVLAFFCLLIPLVLKNQRMDYFLGRFLKYGITYERKEDPRFKIWTYTFQIIKKNIVLGVGIGDVRNELTKEYYRAGENQLAKERFNTHNQFLEVMLENGIIGIIIFLSIFATMIYIAAKNRNSMYGFYILLIIMFFFFEAFLYRIAGVMFFSIFSFLLLHLDSKVDIIKA